MHKKISSKSYRVWYSYLSYCSYFPLLLGLPFLPQRMISKKYNLTIIIHVDFTDIDPPYWFFRGFFLLKNFVCFNKHRLSVSGIRHCEGEYPRLLSRHFIVPFIYINCKCGSTLKHQIYSAISISFSRGVTSRT